MRTLIYKRTHPGDPDRQGRFGIEDCMGQVRTWPFDAVIGVGGIGAEPRSHGLDGKVNWIGIGPHRIGTARRGPVLTFDCFCLFESKGPSFAGLAPRLAARLYARNVRVVRDRLDDEERREVERILALAGDAGPSAIEGLDEAPPAERCLPKKREKPCKSTVKGEVEVDAERCSCISSSRTRSTSPYRRSNSARASGGRVASPVRGEGAEAP